MPKGVEHTILLAPTGTLTRVQRPLMPKGVEHTEDGTVTVTVPLVQRPLMPKGVEHQRYCGLTSPSHVVCRDL